jgi:hypothetical protein
MKLIPSPMHGRLLAPSTAPALALALAVLALALPPAIGLVGCGDTRLCKSGTLFVTVDFQGAALAADSLLVAVTPDGDPARDSTFPHASGAAQDSLEIDFPAGYQVGRHVQLALTAQQAGAATATVTGSVVLVAGCSTLNIRIGDGAGDGGGVIDGAADAPADVPTGAGGGGTASDGGTGTGGAAGKADAGGGTGGKADAGGGTGGSGVDAGCVFQSAEDCFNGIDDDCNGHTDCDDPACTPSTMCVPAAGSNGFVAGAYVDPAAGCPARFDAGGTAINATLIPGAGCTGCSCVAGISCSANLYKYASSTACTLDLGLTGGTLAGSISSTLVAGTTTATASCLASTFTMATQARIGPYVTTNGPCAPRGTPTLTTPTWGTSRKYCSAASIGSGCTPGYVCVPKAAPNHCVLALGARLCPAGYTKDATGSWYTGFTDTRTCSACTCGTQTPGSCTPLQASFYFGTTTNTCIAGVHRSGGSGSQICTISNDCASAGFGGTPTAPTCPGVSTATGAATATGEQTLCCL